MISKDLFNLKIGGKTTLIKWVNQMREEPYRNNTSKEYTWDNFI